jgi:hypothetical protein
VVEISTGFCMLCFSSYIIQKQKDEGRNDIDDIDDDAEVDIEVED